MTCYIIDMLTSVRPVSHLPTSIYQLYCGKSLIHITHAQHDLTIRYFYKRLLTLDKLIDNHGLASLSPFFHSISASDQCCLLIRNPRLSNWPLVPFRQLRFPSIRNPRLSDWFPVSVKQRRFLFFCFFFFCFCSVFCILFFVLSCLPLCSSL